MYPGETCQAYVCTYHTTLPDRYGECSSLLFACTCPPSHLMEAHGYPYAFLGVLMENFLPLPQLAYSICICTIIYFLELGHRSRQDKVT